MPDGRCLMTPYYSSPDVQIFRTDARALPLADESVHLIVTSPPYNLGKDYGTARDDQTYDAYMAQLQNWASEWARVLVQGGRLCLNIPLDINLSFDGGSKSKKRPFLADATSVLLDDERWLYNTTILWLEGNVSRRTAWGSWLSASDPWVNTAAEAVLVLSKNTRKRDGKGRVSNMTREEFMDWTLGLWAFGGESAKRIGHPAPFPEELPRRLISLFSFVGDTVLDPFMGSGTTLKVARDRGRVAVGVDIESAYCELALRRLGLATLEKAG